MVSFHAKEKGIRKLTPKEILSSLFTLREALERQAFLQSRDHHVLYNIFHLYTLGSPQYSSK